MNDACLVTGGAGFIGSALSRGLADRFERVVAFDSLHAQVHSRRERPSALDERVRLVVGDVRDPDDWDAVLAHGPFSHVVHLAAETGTGQSLTEASRHASVNVVGTTRMLEALARHESLPRRILLASSRAVYGEGAWVDASGQVQSPGQRSHEMLAAGQWDFPGLRPLPASAEATNPNPTSVYGATKLAQEHVLRAWCLSVRVELVVARLQNVYGPGQSPTNPYTGIVPLFAQLARAGQVIPLYEDGQIVRDFVYIDDVVTGLMGMLAGQQVEGAPVDIGAGVPITISALAELVARRYQAPPPEVTGQFRDGDVRYACATHDDATRLVEWTPQMSLSEGVEALCDWLDAL